MAEARIKPEREKMEADLAGDGAEAQRTRFKDKFLAGYFADMRTSHQRMTGEGRPGIANPFRELCGYWAVIVLRRGAPPRRLYLSRVARPSCTE